MKAVVSIFFALLILTLTTPAFAASIEAKPETMAQLPSAIKCLSEALSPNAQTFSIYRLDTTEPDASIYDASLMDLPLETTDAVTGKTTISISFSNQCDNGYDLAFDLVDLVRLKAGAVISIKATLVYGDVDLFDKTQGQRSEESVVVTCTL